MLGDSRRLNKDYELLPATAEAVIHLAMVQHAREELTAMLAAHRTP